MIPADCAQAMSDGEVINGARPEFIRKTKRLVRLPAHFLQFEKRRRRKNQSPDFLQIHKPQPKLFDHGLDIDCRILGLRVKTESKSRHSFRTVNTVPMFRRQLHLTEQRADCFCQYGGQIRQLVSLDWSGAEQSLTEFEPTKNCFDCGTQVYCMTPYFTIPALVGKTVSNERARESEVSAHWLPDLFPKQCTKHGIKNSIRHRAFVSMTQILRRDEIKTGLEHGLNQRADPIGRHGFNAGFNNATCLDT